MSLNEVGRGRQSPNPVELAVWREYVETAEAIRQALASGLQSASNVSPGDYAVLLALSEAEEHRLRSSVLAEGIGWERSRLSHHLGRMENRGLIRRHRSGNDSRGAEVELTDEGTRTFRSSSASHLRLVRRLFVDALSHEDLQAAGRVATNLRRHLKDIASEQESE
ncbi:MarR family winged helix-turn-helix transcriptional regulator [Arthrobacter sp. ISL-28]|uniref:MarR family winged helix-turn-helix transcriptional regulator n=1 Tax=Arthrobacter sp. ISL-28 TaxID=2819108 RepID=UPI001BE76F61|nr:MarR family winged helix-turn-helix transcriptional regulator [Arthrobacter sp. ISL-28]MBT2522506.1 winged helix-turn-helix transcriptional regulator [Arthrobacter sp. ISL-28]